MAPYPATPCTLITRLGHRQEAGIMWYGGQCESSTLHVARKFVSEMEPDGVLEMPDILDVDWDGAVCDHCGAPEPGEDGRKRFGGLPAIWDTEDGKHTTPGSMYWLDHSAWHECFDWDNCTGTHLHVILPNGHPWDIDSRASNCDRKDDRLHRCWVREGEPPTVTAGKVGGDTCGAGAGSIQAGDYHGFLQSGTLTAG